MNRLRRCYNLFFQNLALTWQIIVYNFEMRNEKIIKETNAIGKLRRKVRRLTEKTLPLKWYLTYLQFIHRMYIMTETSDLKVKWWVALSHVPFNRRVCINQTIIRSIIYYDEWWWVHFRVSLCCRTVEIFGALGVCIRSFTDTDIGNVNDENWSKNLQKI